MIVGRVCQSRGEAPLVYCQAPAARSTSTRGFGVVLVLAFMPLPVLAARGVRAHAALAVASARLHGFAVLLHAFALLCAHRVSAVRFSRAFGRL